MKLLTQTQPNSYCALLYLVYECLPPREYRTRYTEQLNFIPWSLTQSTVLHCELTNNIIKFRPLQVVVWFLVHHPHQIITIANFSPLLTVCMYSYPVCHFTHVKLSRLLLKSYAYTLSASLWPDPIFEA